LAHFQSFVAGEASTQILRLSYFSRLRSPVRKLLALIKRAVSHLTTTLVVSSAAYVPPPVTDTAPPPSLDANPKAAVEASKLTAAAEFDFASELEAFSVLCKQSSITKEEVRREYRRLAPKFHPDHAGFDNTHNFQALSACYTNYLNPVEALDPAWVAAERADIEKRVADFEKRQTEKLTAFRADNTAACVQIMTHSSASCEKMTATAAAVTNAATRVTDAANRLTDTAIRLTDTAIRVTDTAIRVTDTAIRVTDTATAAMTSATETRMQTRALCSFLGIDPRRLKEAAAAVMANASADAEPTSPSLKA